MKKLFIIIFGLTLFLPLYAQEAGSDGQHEQINEVWDKPGGESEYTAEEQYDQEEGFEDDFILAERKITEYARQKWEFGLISNIGVGFDNDIIGTGEIFKKNIVIDVDKIKDSLTDDGAHINFDTALDIFFLNIKNIAIQEGIWDFGFFINADGGIGLNLPKSLFILASEGNTNQYNFEGMISASGGVYASAGFSGAAQYKVKDKNLRVGLKTSLFSPLIFIPKSGIDYTLNTENDITLNTTGEINIYSPILDGETGFGFDLSLEGEYALFDFLDIGGSFSQIPFVPAALEKRTQFRMNDMEMNIKIEDLLNGSEDSGIPDFDFDFDETHDSAPIKVFRPLRFDTYARYRPLNTDLVVLQPNIGFSVDVNEKEGYFNIGFDAQVNLNHDMFMAHLGTFYEEGIWKHQLGIVLNLRAVELHMEAALRSPSFAGTFQGKGFGVNIGLCYGW